MNLTEFSKVFKWDATYQWYVDLLKDPPKYQPPLLITSSEMYHNFIVPMKLTWENQYSCRELLRLTKPHTPARHKPPRAKVRPCR